MSAAYLIDGYNLLHAMGLMGSSLGPQGLEMARHRLVGLLRGALEDESGAVTVVFDGAGNNSADGAEQCLRGIHVQFAKGKQEADDVIESVIRRWSAPKDLFVVSDDRRIQRAARRRSCQVWGCEPFLAWLDRHRKERQAKGKERPEKDEGLSSAEAEKWMAEFGDVEHDPSLRKAFESFDFEKDDGFEEDRK
jgi:predicted RNA-binding protein with PIN domain